MIVQELDVQMAVNVNVIGYSGNETTKYSLLQNSQDRFSSIKISLLPTYSYE